MKNINLPQKGFLTRYKRAFVFALKYKNYKEYHLMNIRRYKYTDTLEIIKLFFETVREINIKDYTKEQVIAWAPEEADLEKWKDRLSKFITFVVEDNEKIVGFSELEEDGHINCFYSHKDYQGKGIGKLMISNIEEQAKILRLSRLYAEVSITAKPFFEKKGFRIIKEQEVELRGVKFINYLMEKFI